MLKKVVFILSLIPILATATWAGAAENPGAVAQGSLILTKSVPFRQDQPIKLDLNIGGLRIPDLRITKDEGTLIDSILPPRGGQSRFSFQRYALFAENPDNKSWRLSARVRLLDKNGAVIDEFEFRGTVRSGRAKAVDFKRLTLNYVLPLVDKVELTLSAEQ